MKERRIALDVHAHLVPVREAKLGECSGVAWSEAEEILTVDDHALGIKNLFKPSALLSWMDANGVDRACISVPPPVYRRHLCPGEAQAWTLRLNEGLQKIADNHADRLLPLLHLPIEHPEVAISIASSLGTATFAICAGGEDDEGLSNSALEPLWSLLNARKAFVFLHPGQCCDPRLEPFYLHNLLGNPHETAVAVAHLVFGGVIARFPDIRFCLAHGGGTVAAVAGRWQRGWNSSRPGLSLEHGEPLELLRGLSVDCISHSPGMLQVATQVFGEGAIFFGSDWPFPMGMLDPHGDSDCWPAALRAQIFAKANLGTAAPTPTGC